MSKKGKYNSPLKATIEGIKDLYRGSKESVQLPENIDLSKKSILVTGASSGLGFATVERLARFNAEVIMTARSFIPEKVEEIKKEAGNRKISMRYVDLLDFETIDNLIEGLYADGIQLDIMISNAAMVPLKSRRTQQGLEEMFMVNYLSAFYLIKRLLDKGILKDTGKVIIVSSESHRNANDFDWENFGKFTEYGAGSVVGKYGYYKLFLTTFANELNRRYDKLSVHSLCPGPVNSNIAREAPKWMKPILKVVFSIFFRSPEKASDPIIYFVSTDHSSTAKVDYLFTMQQREMDEKAVSKENGKMLWSKTIQLLEKMGYTV